MPVPTLSSKPAEGQNHFSDGPAEPPGPGREKGPVGDEETRAALKDILESLPAEPRQLLPLLVAVQGRFRYLPETAIRGIAEHLKLPLARVFAVASFYQALSMKPQGDRVVKVCCGTACHLRGAPDIIKALEKELGLIMGETRSDRAFTLESVYCLGACALAPVLTINDETHGDLKATDVAGLFRPVREKP